MTIETRIRAQLAAEREAIPERTGSFDAVIARGRSRRRRSRILVGFSGLVLAAAVVGGIGVAGIAGGPETIASPLTDRPLVVLADHPSVLRGELGPPPQVTPPGREVPLQTQREVADDQRRAIRQMFEDKANPPVIAVGKLDGMSIFVATRTGLSRSTGDATNSTVFLGLIRRDDSAVAFTGEAPPLGNVDFDPGRQAGLATAVVDGAASYGVLDVSGDRSWQRAIEGVVAIPFTAERGDTVELTVYDASGAPLFTYSYDVTQAYGAYVASQAMQDRLQSVEEADELDTWLEILTNRFRGDVLPESEWGSRLAQVCAAGVSDAGAVRQLVVGFISDDLALERDDPLVATYAARAVPLVRDAAAGFCP
ncbi:MAG: hypothetical protein PVI35_00495 [Acidimicrobiia bacterium]|jgi:hypothetical protein